MNRTNKIGVVLPDITKIFFPDVLKGIQDAAKDYKYTIDFLSSDYIFDNERKYIEQLKSSRVDGIIIDTCCDYHKQDEWAKELVEWSNDGAGFPVVSLEQQINTNVISSVTVDNKLATKKSVEYLFSIGRKKILYLAAPLSLILSRKRLDGYKAGMEKCGAKLNEELILFADFFC